MATNRSQKGRGSRKIKTTQPRIWDQGFVVDVVLFLFPSVAM